MSICRLAAIALALFSVSCATTNPGPATYSGKGPELHVRLVKETVTRGEDVRAVISIDNRKQPPHRLDFPTGCKFTWTITTADGMPFTTRCITCTQAPSSIVLAGTAFTATITVPTRRLCDLPWPFEDDFMPPGVYTLGVYAIGYEDVFHTNLVQFEIVDTVPQE